ncbi:hypothetical protein RD792_013369 [Penstemon davidsonii]|uniref:Uncharacterized protein n=1 Tax=Penstemon davidsonii TaxID=160366 RepID=A0ABR0CTA1_9LAMI|nr:hypothetical protein RD792_013369 [Penstemon davidsonii]
MAPEKETAAQVANAFKAMKRLGIAPGTVKPVLKNLLKLYDGNWALIEEDNYRTLADAIFEAAEDKQKAEQNGSMSEPPRKKPHIGLPEDRASSTLDNRKNMIDLQEEEELPRNSSGTKRAQSVSGDTTNSVRHIPTRRKGKEPVRVFSPPAEENADTQPTPLAIAYHDPNGTDLGSKREIKLDNGNEHVIVPDGKSYGSGSSNIHQKISHTTQDIASSTCGQVKISLTCNRDVGQHSFHHPNANEVLSIVEKKYKKKYDNDGARFSMEDLLRELCECYLEIGSGSVNVNRSPINILPDKKKIPSASRPLSSRGLVIASKKRAVHMVCDITKGTEKVEISLLDGTGNGDLPEFVYSPENIVYQSAYVHVSLARISDEDCCSSCIGDCLSSSIPCACARDTGGEFAYTPEGLLNERFLDTCISMMITPQEHQMFYCQNCPLERAKNASRPAKCKGHLLKKFIKECWRKCGCSMQCGNRVVQRGISRKLQVFLTSEGKGWGIRALEEIPKGAFICEYTGEILTNAELYTRNNKKSSGKDKHVYPVLLDADWATEEVLKDEDALCLDATYYGNVARFINHRCHDGNLIEVPVQVETPDRHYYHVCLSHSMFFLFPMQSADLFV